MKNDIRVFDCHGRFIGRVDAASAQTAVIMDIGKIEGHNNQGTRLTLRADLDSYAGEGGPCKYTYTEHFGGHPIVILKRLIDGTFHKWDNDLTFDELRRGVTVSKSAKKRKLLSALEAKRC